MKRGLLILAATLSLVVLVAGCGGGGGSASGGAAGKSLGGDAAKGKAYFVETCASCHGQDAKGMTGLGKDLTASTWVKQQSDEQLLKMLQVGRPASDPLNTTKVDMPPRGGNPSYNDEKLIDIIAHMRTVNKAK